MTMSKCWWAMLLVALVMAAGIPWVSPILAQKSPDSGPHGLFSEIIGPYELGVIAIPSSLSIGKVTFIVFVVEAPSGEPVPNANVVIRVEHKLAEAEGYGLAVHTTDIPEQYNAIMNLDHSGEWRATVEVTSALGKVEVEVPPVVVPAQRQRTAGSLVFLGMSGVVLLGAAYVIWTVRRAQKRRNAANAG